MSRRTFGIITAILGGALIIISALADVIGIGSGGFGARQIAGVGGLGVLPRKGIWPLGMVGGSP